MKYLQHPTNGFRKVHFNDFIPHVFLGCFSWSGFVLLFSRRLLCMMMMYKGELGK